MRTIFKYKYEAPSKVEADVLRDLYELGIAARHARSFKGGRIVSIVYPVGRDPKEFELGITSDHAYAGELPRRLKEILAGIL